jgi:hypothetical protein
MIHGSSVSDHLGEGVDLGGHSSEGSLISWNNCDVSGRCRAIKPSQVAVLWSLLTFARKTICHP